MHTHIRTFDDREQEREGGEGRKGFILECGLQSAFSSFQGDCVGGFVIKNL